jgi:hypothetical protein
VHPPRPRGQDVLVINRRLPRPAALPAALLGGMPLKLRRPCAVSRADGDAGAAADGGLPVLDGDLGAQLSEDAVGHLDGLHVVGARQDERELIAAEPREAPPSWLQRRSLTATCWSNASPAARLIVSLTCLNPSR